MQNINKKPPTVLLSYAKYAGLGIVAISLIAGYFIWHNWSSLIISSMQWQREVSAQLSELLYEARENSIAAGLSLVGLSFTYGILHSLGPGHGKFIVSTYVATHPTKVKTSLVLTVISALLQAVVAIILVSILVFIFDSSMREVNTKANYFITFSFYSIVILGSVIVWRNLRSIWNLSHIKRPVFTKNETGHSGKSLIAFQQHYNGQAEHSTNNQHVHTDSCGCGHKHFVEADAINSASSLKEYVGIILSIGLRPCTGAIMVLLFANMLNIYWLGMLSAFVMAIGTALTASTIAIMTITGKKIIKHYIAENKQSESKNIYNLSFKKRVLISPLLQLVGGALLILMGTVLAVSQPVGMSPIF